MRRWFLQRLQERIPRLFCEHVRLIDDVAFVGTLERHGVDSFTKLAHLVDTTIRCGIYLIQIFFGDTELARKDAGNGRLPCSTSTVEKIRMPYLLVLDGRLQRVRHMILPTHRTPLLRPVCAIECLMRIFHAESIASASSAVFVSIICVRNSFA